MMKTPTPAQNIDKSKFKISNTKIENRAKIEKSLLVVDKLACPNDLSPEAKKTWRSLMKLYKQMDSKILCDLDKNTLRMYCEHYCIYLQAQKQLNEITMKYKTIVSSKKDSNAIIQTLMRTIQKESELCVKLSEQLCLSPIGRARMGVAVAKFGLKDENKLENFFNKFSTSDEDEDDDDEEQEDDQANGVESFLNEQQEEE